MSLPLSGTSRAVPGRDEVFAVICDAVVVVLEVEPETLSAQTAFMADLGADSLALVEIVEIVEETLVASAGPGFRIDDDDLDSLMTIGDAVDYAVARL